MFVSLIGLLLSFSVNQLEKKLIGSWKVITVIKEDGTKKEGRKMITFRKDGAVESMKDNGSKMTGFWKYDKKQSLLQMSDETKEKWTDFKVLKLTGKELILKDERKTYETVRTKHNTK
ncbi:protein of unknown function [Tenacibaculum sp. 190524A02b]